MDQSRYVRYSTRKTPRHRRSIFIHGAFEERNKYFRCWNCGQICNMDEISASSGVGGGTYQIDDNFTASEPFASGDSLTATASLDAPDFLGVIMEQDADGVNKTIDEDHIYSPSVFAGCPLCGTRNLP